MSIITNSNNYSLYSFLESEDKVKETVNAIVQKDKQAHSDAIFKDTFKESHWEKESRLYLRIEKWLQNNSEYIPTWEVTGSLHYGMSFADIKASVTEKLRELAKNKKIKRESSIVNPEKYFPNDNSRNNLTRIWGSQFLQNKLEKETRVKAAEHFLVVYDTIDEVEINICVLNDKYPVISSINFTSGYVLAEKINGEQNTADYKLPTLVAAGYRDFSDPGNILEDSSKIGWIVDTESKSFVIPSMDDTGRRVTDYLKKRFDFLNAEQIETTIKIPLSDIF